MRTQEHAQPDFRPALGDLAQSWFSRHWRPLVGFALLLGLFVVLVLVGHQRTAEHDALARLTPQDRRLLFEETRRSAELLCRQAQAEPALSDRCTDAAQFLLAFPECDESCVAFARQHERKATR